MTENSSPSVGLIPNAPADQCGVVQWQKAVLLVRHQAGVRRHAPMYIHTATNETLPCAHVTQSVAKGPSPEQQHLLRPRYSRPLVHAQGGGRRRLTHRDWAWEAGTIQCPGHGCMPFISTVINEAAPPVVQEYTAAPLVALWQ